MVIIAVSDQHLGYNLSDKEKSDKDSFNAFLDSKMWDDPEITDLVLLGDVVDMWRRDASGVFLENRDTFDKIASLPKRVTVHYVAGNHDFHVLQLKDHSYPFNFVNTLRLSEGNLHYNFVHGYQFDKLQQKRLMEALCRRMSDTAGNFESGVWATLTRDWSDLEYFLSLFFKKASIRKSVEKLQLKPEERLVGTREEVENLARTSTPPGEVLVFGHTHNPFINESATVVNTGCWVTDAPIYNTYARLDASGPRIFIFEGREITERVKD